MLGHQKNKNQRWLVFSKVSNVLNKRILLVNIFNSPKQISSDLLDFCVKEKIDLVVCDVSFISLKKVILPSIKLLSKNSEKKEFF